MKSRKSVSRVVLSAFACPALVVGLMSLGATPAEARGPIGPQCGPTYQWSCQKAGGPSFLFIGTICDKAAYEAKTGRTCTAF